MLRETSFFGDSSMVLPWFFHDIAVISSGSIPLARANQDKRNRLATGASFRDVLIRLGLKTNEPQRVPTDFKPFFNSRYPSEPSFTGLILTTRRPSPSPCFSWDSPLYQYAFLVILLIREVSMRPSS